MKLMNICMMGGLSLALVASAAVADAATIRVRCEQRANRSPDMTAIFHLNEKAEQLRAWPNVGTHGY